MQHFTARHYYFQTRANSQQFLYEWSSRHDLLEVVQHEQEMPVAQCNLHPIKDGLRSYLLNSKLLRDSGNYQIRFIDRNQRDKTDTIGEVRLHFPRYLIAQPGFADASRSQDRHQPNTGTLQYLPHVSYFFVPSAQSVKCNC